MGPIPLFPASKLSQKASLPIPFGAIIPSPETTTLFLDLMRVMGHSILTTQNPVIILIRSGCTILNSQTGSAASLICIETQTAYGCNRKKCRERKEEMTKHRVMRKRLE
jgi:hypothetical protein